MNLKTLAGCLGLAFAAWFGPTPDASAQDRTNIETIVCGSQNYARNTCRVPGRIVSVEPRGQLSVSPCRRGESWGVERRSVWVDRGCQAIFEITYQEGRRDRDDADADADGDPDRGRNAERDRQRNRNRGADDAAPQGTLTASAIMANPTMQQRMVVAQAACTGAHTSSPRRQGGSSFIFTVPRNCKAEATMTCEQICSNATLGDPISRFIDVQNPQCTNSIHVYNQGEVRPDSVSGNVTLIYDNCTTGACGPNFCCCKSAF